MPRPYTPIPLILAVWVSFAPPVAAQSTAKEKALYVRLLHSSTWVVALKPSKPGTVTWGEGSGWVVNAKNRLVITNYHVVAKDKNVQVFFPYYVKGQALTARKPYVNLIATGGGSAGRILAVDPRRDLALLQLQWTPNWVKSLTIAATGVTPGDHVYNLGNPGGDSSLWQFSSSKVLRVDKRQIKSKLSEREDLMVHARIVETDDTKARKGQSGSVVVNARGELVGVVQSISQTVPQTTMCVDRQEVLDFLKTHGVKPLLASERKK